jgi:MinD superfamily P-loop ATPase
VKEVTEMTKDFEAYLRLDKTGLENKYVIIVNGEVVAKGENIESMLEKVKREYPHEIPFVAKVPDERMLIL